MVKMDQLPAPSARKRKQENMKYVNYIALKQ